MTRKDYERIARALAACRPSTLEGTTTRSNLSSAEQVWCDAVLNLDLSLKDDNPRFDGAKFRAECFAKRPNGRWWWKEPLS